MVYRMQTREYLENYWLLFLDFIKLFKDLSYYHIPLPLLLNYYQYLDSNIKASLGSPKFKRHLKQKALPPGQTQPAFEHWLRDIKPTHSSEITHGKTLLFFDYLRFTPNSYKYFDPKETVILARWKRDNLYGLPVHSITDYIPEVKRVIARYDSLAKELFDAVKDHIAFGSKYLFDTFMERLPKMIEHIAAINRYFDNNVINCVVVGTTEDLTARILCLVAASRGIPSICLQHGLLGGDEAYIPAFSTAIAVFGHYEKDWYLKMGLAEERIKITGHPRFDDIFTQQHMPKNRFVKMLNLNPLKKTVLLVTQPNFSSLWDGLLKLLAKSSDLQIAIKPHPIEFSKGRGERSLAVYGYYANKYTSVTLITKKGPNLNDVLPNVDVVVTNLSTGGLEAMLFEKPLLLLSDVDFSYFYNLSDLVFSNPAELVKTIDSAGKIRELIKSSQNKRERFLQYAYPQKISGPLLLEAIRDLTN